MVVKGFGVMGAIRVQFLSLALYVKSCLSEDRTRRLFPNSFSYSFFWGFFFGNFFILFLDL